MFHVVAVAFGLSAILATSDLAFGVIKWLGAGYLIFLGVKSLTHGGAATLGEGGKSIGVAAAFRQGVLVDLINPKSALFFMAFLPQFTVASAGHLPLQLMVLGMTVILVGLMIEAGAALGAARLTIALRSRPRFALWMDRVLGGLLIGLGLRLAMQQRA
jgi:threonine/homoserine/homoserine lactone efflux protein